MSKRGAMPLGTAVAPVEHREAAPDRTTRVDVTWPGLRTWSTPRDRAPVSCVPGRTSHSKRRRGGGAGARRVLPDGRGDGPLRTACAGEPGSAGAGGAGTVPVAGMDPGRLPRDRRRLRGHGGGAASGVAAADRAHRPRRIRPRSPHVRRIGTTTPRRADASLSGASGDTDSSVPLRSGPIGHGLN